MVTISHLERYVVTEILAIPAESPRIPVDHKEQKRRQRGLCKRIVLFFAYLQVVASVQHTFLDSYLEVERSVKLHGGNTPRGQKGTQRYTTVQKCVTLCVTLFRECVTLLKCVTLSPENNCNRPVTIQQ